MIRCYFRRRMLRYYALIEVQARRHAVTRMPRHERALLMAQRLMQPDS